MTRIFLSPPEMGPEERPMLLDAVDSGWLDAYHRRVRAAVAPLLDPAAAAWLEAATRPLGEG